MSAAPAVSVIGGAALIIALLVAGMVVLEDTTANISAGVYLREGKLKDAQKESLTVMLDLVKLLMSWAVAVIGASGFFLKLTVEKDVPIRKLDLALVFCIILLSVISLFLGHLVVDHSAQILALDQFPLTNDRVRTFGRYQYLAGLGSIALFGLHVFQFFWARTSRD
jgi:hypothetical protein